MEYLEESSGSEDNVPKTGRNSAMGYAVCSRKRGAMDIYCKEHIPEYRTRGAAWFAGGDYGVSCERVVSGIFIFQILIMS